MSFVFCIPSTIGPLIHAQIVGGSVNKTIIKGDLILILLAFSWLTDADGTMTVPLLSQLKIQIRHFFCYSIVIGRIFKDWVPGFCFT